MRARHFLLMGLGIGLLCLGAQRICAAEEVVTTTAGSGWSSFRAVLALMVVLALILVGAWAARRFLPFLPQNPQKNDQIQVLSMRALGPRRSIHLLQVDGHRLLIGSTDTHISLLKELGSSSPGERS